MFHEKFEPIYNEIIRDVNFLHAVQERGDSLHVS